MNIMCISNENFKSTIQKFCPQRKWELFLILLVIIAGLIIAIIALFKTNENQAVLATNENNGYDSMMKLIIRSTSRPQSYQVKSRENENKTGNINQYQTEEDFSEYDDFSSVFPHRHRNKRNFEYHPGSDNRHLMISQDKRRYTIYDFNDGGNGDDQDDDEEDFHEDESEDSDKLSKRSENKKIRLNKSNRWKVNNKNLYSKEESKNIKKYDLLGSGNFEIIRGGILDKHNSNVGNDMQRKLKHHNNHNNKIIKRPRKQHHEENSLSNEKDDDEETSGIINKDNEDDSETFEPFDFDLFANDPILQGLQGYDNFAASQRNMKKVKL